MAMQLQALARALRMRASMIVTRAIGDNVRKYKYNAFAGDYCEIYHSGGLSVDSG